MAGSAFRYDLEKLKSKEGVTDNIIDYYRAYNEWKDELENIAEDEYDIESGQSRMRQKKFAAMMKMCEAEYRTLIKLHRCPGYGITRMGIYHMWKRVLKERSEIGMNRWGITKEIKLKVTAEICEMEMQNETFEAIMTDDYLIWLWHRDSEIIGLWDKNEKELIVYMQSGEMLLDIAKRELAELLEKELGWLDKLDWNDDNQFDRWCAFAPKGNPRAFLVEGKFDGHLKELLREVHSETEFTSALAAAKENILESKW